MPYYFFVWNDETIEHLAEHGVSMADFERVICNPEETGVSRSSGREIAFGYAADGRYLLCAYEHLDEDTILPITAYVVED